jgi:uncharacterized protein YjbI with pentapeptide repeats
MPQDHASLPSPAPLAATFQLLAQADPAQRTALVLRLVEGHPEGRLELPATEAGAAALNEVDLSREALHALQANAAAAPPWWDAQLQVPHFRRADLRGASLRRADLRGAVFEEANFASADLAGARLQGAALAGVDFQEAMLEEADLRSAALRFARLRGSVLEGAKLGGADLWGAQAQGVVLAGADLRAATLEEADLRGADLQRADLRGAVLRKTNLEGANLQGADLQGAVLGGTNLRGAVLRDAKLQALTLTGCDLAHVHTSDVWLERTRLRADQLGGAIGEELAGEYELARRGYLALERNFDELGDPDASSWAYRRKRRMQKREARRRARAAAAAGSWVAAARWYLQFVSDQLVEWMCDYGESIPRVLGSMLAMYLFFIVLYGITGSVVRMEDTPEGGAVRVATHRPVDLAIFSLTAMTSATPAVGLQPRTEFVHLLTGIQSLLAIALTGLLGFVAGNRIRR